MRYVPAVSDGWREAPIPDAARGRGELALVVLDERIMAEEGIEYYGNPVAVALWDEKIKTTLHPMRIEYDWVTWWKLL